MIDLGADGVSPNVPWRTGATSHERRHDSLHAIICTPIAAAAVWMFKRLAQS